MGDHGFGDTLPEGAVDITEAVTSLKDKIHEAFQGNDIIVIVMALGSVIGETIDDEEIIHEILTRVASVAGATFSMINHPEQIQEEGSVH